MSTNHDFCRALLSATMEDVRQQVDPEDIKKAWTYKYTDGRCEFHGPDEHYWYGQACCRWAARIDGWESYLREKKVRTWESWARSWTENKETRPPVERRPEA